MKLLSYIQFATLLAVASIATVQASEFL